MQKLFTNLTVKAVEGESEEAPYGAFEAVLSAPVEDRDQEIIDPGAFNALPKSIPILADHDGQVAKLVARAEPYYDGDVLRAKGYFGSHPLAQYVRGLLTEGLLDTMSVGFMNAVRTVKDGAKHITGGELLEASFVVIPSNRDALVTAAKAFGAIGADGTKALKGPAGSYEERISDVRALVASVNDGIYVESVATYDDRVVYRAYNWHEDTQKDFEVTYELGDDGISLGDPVEVEIRQVVTPKAYNLFMDAKSGRRNSGKDQTALQAAHDALVDAGADCKAENVPEAEKATAPTENVGDMSVENFTGDGLKALADVIEMDLDDISQSAGWVEK